MEKVHNEIQRINTNCGCDYLDDLLTAVFIAHTKVLTAIRLSSNKKKIEINVPKVEHFLFKVLCETSKLLWSSTYLFREDVSSIEKQQNYRNIEQIINEGILQAVRSLVPVKSILKNCISQNDLDESNETPVNEIRSENEITSDEKSLKENEIETETANEIVTTNNIIIENDMLIPIIPSHDEDHNSITHEPNEDNTPPTILNIDNDADQSKVKFAGYSSVFNEHDSDMLEFNEDDDDDYVSKELQILDYPAEPISLFDELSELNKSPVEELLSENDFNLSSRFKDLILNI
jgi:hypothetical protein